MQTGSTEVTAIPAAMPLAVRSPSLPRAALSALTESREYVTGQGAIWTASKALVEIKAAGLTPAAVLARARDALVPVDRGALMNRLSTMQLAMTQGWGEAKATAWLSETARLLEDLPGDIAEQAIDDAVKASVRGFLPSVGEIRAFAAEKMEKRTIVLKRAEAVVREAERACLPAPQDRGAGYVTPDEIAAIRAEVGLEYSTPIRAPKRHAGPPRTPSEADYIAIMGEAAWRASIEAGLAPPPPPAVDDETDSASLEWVEQCEEEYRRSVMSGGKAKAA